ncbi:MAG: HIRAN domain-containing protein [Methylotenera sp.]|nr:HIRAN domain-containing protein [Methylotenera sp.]
MSRRLFLQSLGTLLGGLAMPTVVKASQPHFKTLQISPIAGFQYHQGETLWTQLAINQPLQLVREENNIYDNLAVLIEWQGRKLGYLPKLDNAAVSQLLDRGERLEAVITKLQESSNPWERVKVEVRWLV